MIFLVGEEKTEEKELIPQQEEAGLELKKQSDLSGHMKKLVFLEMASIVRPAEMRSWDGCHVIPVSAPG